MMDGHTVVKLPEHPGNLVAFLVMALGDDVFTTEDTDLEGTKIGVNLHVPDELLSEAFQIISVLCTSFVVSTALLLQNMDVDKALATSELITRAGMATNLSKQRLDEIIVKAADPEQPMVELA
jgi:hypothetical protein